MSEPLTPLEYDLMRLTAEENWPGFRLDGLKVTKRDNTGAGRYTYLEDAHAQQLVDGDYSAQYRWVDMDGIVNGMGWIVAVSDRKLLYIDIHTFGNITWDGVERPWRIRGGVALPRT